MTVDYLPPTRRLPPKRLAAMRAELELFVATDQQPVRRRRWRRRGFLGGLGAVALVGIGGGTAIALVYLHSRPVTDRSVARCYSVATYTGGRVFPGSTIATVSTATEVGSVKDAVETCGALWRAGILQPDAPRAIVHPGRSFYPVPALVGCTLPNGTAAVFPGPPETCERLGLAAESPPAVAPSQPLPASAATPANASQSP